MAQQLRVPYADRNGDLVHVSQTTRGLACGCICIECGGRLIARKGQKTTHHFAHHTSERRCDGESLLHSLGKRLVAQRIAAAIGARRAVAVVWKCERCYLEHEADLAQGATRIAVEHTIRTAGGAIRPDVTVFGLSGAPRALIEVTVTHEPEQPVHDFALKNGVAVVEFQLDTAADLKMLDQAEPLRPARATIDCLTDACPACGDPLLNESVRYVLYVVEGPCWKCGSNMKIALWEGVEGGIYDHLGPCLFGPSGRAFGLLVEDGQGPDEEELSLARRHGAVIQRQYSRTMGGSYMANTCTRCKAFVGANYEDDYADLINTSNQVAEYSRCQHCGCGTCNCKN